MSKVQHNSSIPSHSELQVLLQDGLSRTIIDSLPYPFYIVDAHDYTIKTANAATAVFGEITKETTCYALTHRVDRPCQLPDHMCPLKEVKETKKPVVLEHIHYDKDGNAMCMEIHGYPILNSDGDVVQMIEYSLDITDRKRMEELLRDSEEQFRSVLQSAHDAIISIDSRGKVIFWNRAAEKIFGYTAHEAIGEPVSITMPQRFRERHAEGLHRIVATGKARIIGKKTEVVGLKKDGAEFPLELTLAKWETSRGMHFTGILRDITERKRGEQELRKANDKMRADLEVAVDVQRSLLPSEYLEIGAVRFASAFKPCEELGGDILNVLPLGDRLVGLYVLDVSSHGVQAALLSVTLSRLLSALTEQSSPVMQPGGGTVCHHLVQPVDIAEELNRQFPMDSEKLQYFTLVYGVFDLETNIFRYVSAGHPGLIYLPHDSAAGVLEKPAFPIGWFREPSYAEHTVSMNPGDRLYLYSDGVTEAMNSRGEQFGTGRLVDTLGQSRRVPIGDSISSVLQAVREWRGDAPLEDDISILAIEVAAHEPG